MKLISKQVRRKVLFYLALWSNRLVMLFNGLQIKYLYFSGRFLARLTKLADYFYHKYMTET